MRTPPSSALATALALALVACVAPAHSAQTANVVGAASGFVTTTDNVRIHYLEKGKGPAILFVPGWAMPAEIWEWQIARFSKTHRVVAMDPRSQGQSSQPAEGHYPAARARDIRAVVDQLKLAPVVLVGWSMGVAEAAAYVEQFGSGSLAGLVLVDGIAGGEFDPKVTPMMLQFAGQFQRERATATAAFVKSMFRTPQSEPFLRRMTEASLKTPTSSAVALFVGAFTNDHRAALASVDTPTLIVVAAGGMWMKAYEEMHQSIPGARLEVMEGVGHALFVDDPDGFNQRLERFLAGLRRSSGK